MAPSKALQRWPQHNHQVTFAIRRVQNSQDKTHDIKISSAFSPLSRTESRLFTRNRHVAATIVAPAVRRRSSGAVAHRVAAETALRSHSPALSNGSVSATVQGRSSRHRHRDTHCRLDRHGASLDSAGEEEEAIDSQDENGMHYLPVRSDPSHSTSHCICVCIGTDSTLRRERRIKCDETKPNCKRCVGAGRLCRGVGYNVTPRPLDASAVVAAPVAIGSLPLLAPRISSTAKATELIHLVPHVSDISSSRSPAEELSQYTLSQFHSLTLYVEFLPSRMGCNIALDSAIDAIICALRDLCRSSKKTSVATLTAYAQALVDLQDMIEDLVECLSAETLCATQLLGYFEVINTL